MQQSKPRFLIEKRTIFSNLYITILTIPNITKEYKGIMYNKMTAIMRHLNCCRMIFLLILPSGIIDLFNVGEKIGTVARIQIFKVSFSQSRHLEHQHYSIMASHDTQILGKDHPLRMFTKYHEKLAFSTPRYEHRKVHIRG